LEEEILQVEISDTMIKKIQYLLGTQRPIKTPEDCKELIEELIREFEKGLTLLEEL